MQNIQSIKFLRDARHLVVLQYGRLLIVDVTTGKVRRNFQTDKYSRMGFNPGIAISPDGETIALEAGQTIALFDAHAGLIGEMLRHSKHIEGVLFSADGARLYGASQEGGIVVWDRLSGSIVSETTTDVTPVRLNEMLPGGEQALVTNRRTNLPEIWDAASGRKLLTVGEQVHGVRGLSFTPDGNHVFSGGQRSIRLWDVLDGRQARTFDTADQYIEDVRLDAAGQRALIGDPRRLIRIIDVASGDDIATIRDASDDPGPGGMSHTFCKKEDDPIAKSFCRMHLELDTRSYAFDLSSDGKLAAAGRNDGTIKIYDAAKGTLQRGINAHLGPVYFIKFSPDGAYAISAGHQEKEHVAKLWDTRTGNLVRVFEGHTWSVRAAAFSGDAKSILTGSGDTTLILWDAVSGRQLRTFTGHKSIVRSVAFFRDGKRAVSGAHDGTIKIWDLAAGKAIHSPDAQGGEVHAVAVSPDDKLIASGSTDGTTRVYSSNQGKLVATLVGSATNEWMAIVPEGFFKVSSPKAAPLLSVSRGARNYGVDQMWQSLYSPDLVRDKLANDPDGNVSKAASLINLDKVLDSGPAPDVAITSQSIGGKAGPDFLTITARITDKDKGIGRVEWRVNGVVAAVGQKPAGPGPDYAVTQELALDPGDNTIEVVAYNERNLLASLPARTTIKFTGAADTQKPKLHILAIGINRYVDDGWTPPGEKTPSYFPPLGLAVKDAETFAADMERAGTALYGQKQVQVTYALDHKATRSNLDTIINELSEQVHARDTFILFAAAHGFSVGGRYYLIPQDYQGGENPETLARSAIGQETLQDWLANRIKAKKALFLLDTCRSGALVAGHLRPRDSDVLSEAAIGRLHEATGRPVLTAAALSQDAQEGFIARSGVRHGLFTWALLDALRNGDKNRNEDIELSELVAHVQELVPKLAAELGGTRGSTFAIFPQRPSLQQTARFGSRGEDFAIVRRLH